VATAVNQILITDALSQLGGCLSLGEIQNTTLKKINESLLFFLESSVECEKYSKSAFKLVDGNGVLRVSQELINRMKIEILISDPDHPIMSYLKNWKSSQKINIVHSSQDLTGGFILFLISCAEILRSEITKKYKHSLVLHASDLPKGRGWSPHVWSVLEGNNLLTLSLIEAHEKVDQGQIWLKEHIALEGHELFDEINDKLFQAEIKLMAEAIDKANVITPKSQAGLASNYYP
jgi:methionyl-tRNA formyltransferase